METNARVIGYVYLDGHIQIFKCLRVILLLNTRRHPAMEIYPRCFGVYGIGAEIRCRPSAPDRICPLV